MPLDPVLHLIGLARKAGRLEVGEEPVGALCRAKHAKLILLASDAAPNTYRRAAHFGEIGNVMFQQLPFTKQELGFLLGRTSCAILALTDPGFSASILKRLAQQDPECYGPAAASMREKADRAHQRLLEQRKHEKNLRKGKRKPWVAPPPSSPSLPSDVPPNARSAKGRAKPSNPKQVSPPACSSAKPGPSYSNAPGQNAASGRSFSKRPGPGGRKLTGKPGSIPKK